MGAGLQWSCEREMVVKYRYRCTDEMIEPSWIRCGGGMNCRMEGDGELKMDEGGKVNKCSGKRQVSV